MRIVTKRVYEPAVKADGYRVLVDRLWPRGVKKEELVIDEWCKGVAPSPELRQWFGHEPAKFAEFKARYQTELQANDEPQKLLARAGRHKTLTLIYAAKDPVVNHAVVLRDYLEHLG